MKSSLTSMDWLSKVAKHHEEYIRYIHKMGSTSHAPDLVQEMYLRLVKYDCSDKVIRENGEVNKTYVWRVLSNLFKSYKTSGSKFCFIELDSCIGLEVEQSDIDKVNAYERLMVRLLDEINNLDDGGKYPYNKELFLMYIKDKESRHNREGLGLSVRDISKLTKISEVSIQNTLKNCKEQLSDELREDIEDFNNGQYHLI